MFQHAIAITKHIRANELLNAQLEQADLKYQTLCQSVAAKEASWRAEVDDMLNGWTGKMRDMERSKKQYKKEVSDIKHEHNVEILALKSQHLEEISRLQDEFNRSAKAVDDMSDDLIQNQSSVASHTEGTSQQEAAAELAHAQELEKCDRQLHDLATDEGCLVTEVGELEQQMDEKESPLVYEYEMSTSQKQDDSAQQQQLSEVEEEFRTLEQQQTEIGELKLVAQEESNIYSTKLAAMKSMYTDELQEAMREISMLSARLKSREEKEEKQGQSHQMEIDMLNLKLKCQAELLRTRVEHAEEMTGENVRAAADLVSPRKNVSDAEAKWQSHYAEHEKENRHYALDRAGKECITPAEEKAIDLKVMIPDVGSARRAQSERRHKPLQELDSLNQKVDLLGQSLQGMKSELNNMEKARETNGAMLSHVSEIKTAVLSHVSDTQANSWVSACEIKDGAYLNDPSLVLQEQKLNNTTKIIIPEKVSSGTYTLAPQRLHFPDRRVVTGSSTRAAAPSNKTASGYSPRLISPKGSCAVPPAERAEGSLAAPVGGHIPIINAHHASWATPRSQVGPPHLVRRQISSSNCPPHVVKRQVSAGAPKRTSLSGRSRSVQFSSGAEASIAIPRLRSASPS
jgi:chromosome segregation ATPase